MAATSTTVVGSGAGGLAVAAALSTAGREVHLCDAPEFSEHIDAVLAHKGVERRRHDSEDVELVPIAGAGTDIGSGVAGADLVVVVAPLLAHESMLATIGEEGERLLFFGEGGGALRAVGAGRSPATVAETNTLPYLARIEGLGRVSVRDKTGGLFIASALPSSSSAWIAELIDVWPILEAAQDVFDTLLANYNVIDHVPTVLTNVGRLEGGSGPWPLWGEGCTPAVAAVIDELDSELQDLRRDLGLPERGYEDCLVAQGFAPGRGADLHATIHGSALRGAQVATGPDFLNGRFIREDVPHAMVLIESVARAYGHEVPLTSSLITLTSALLAEDVRATGVTLSSLGLPTTGSDLDALLRGVG